VYSTDDSGRFVNGVLATLAARLRGPEARPGGGPGGEEGIVGS
jgi:hypothetical protein